jgi:hypothetical protein
VRASAAGAQSSRGFGEYQHPAALVVLVAASNGAVDDVGGSRPVTLLVETH